MAGSVLIWEAGEWFLEHADRRILVLLQPASLRHPWVIYLEFREIHGRKRWRLWLFSDSAETELLRKLRSRLTLQQG
jgi:hypothetical protein